MRGTGCVGSQSLITNDLGDETVVGVRTNADILVSGVVDDIQVNVIKSTDADEFTFSAAVFDFSLGGQGVFKFNLTIFLCRYGEEYNLSVQLFFYIFIGQSQGCTDDTGQSSSDGVVLRGRVKSGRESSSSSFCISVTRTRDTSSDASGVLLSSVPGASVGRMDLIINRIRSAGGRGGIRG